MGTCCATQVLGEQKPQTLEIKNLVVVHRQPEAASRQSKGNSYLHSSFEELDVEIVEMQLDNSNRSVDEPHGQKHLGGRPSKFDKRLPSSTNDFVDFSSIRDMQDHVIFTSDQPTKYTKIRLDNGAVYEGEWLKGQRSGFGKLVWPNGSIYEVAT